jgi:hypothetical protein
MMRLLASAAAAGYLAMFGTPGAIARGEGEPVLQAVSDGPLFFARLPVGEYRVEVAYEGVAKQSSTSVPASGQRVLDFRW